MSDASSDFKEACKKSSVVWNCDLLRLNRELTSHSEIFETFRDREQLSLRTHRTDSEDWHLLRVQFETELLGGSDYLGTLHYACLSLDGTGIESYGECTMEYSDSMISHRASCFAGNSAEEYAAGQRKADFLRSDWDRRHELCYAYCAERLTSGETVGDFQSILVEVDDSGSGWFVEVHIFGPITASTFSRVSIDTSRGQRSKSGYIEAVIEKLENAEVLVEER